MIRVRIRFSGLTTLGQCKISLYERKQRKNYQKENRITIALKEKEDTS